jgi:hypothetical protein
MMLGGRIRWTKATGKTDLKFAESGGLFLADSVAKVFLRDGSQILRAVGATIELGCGGPRRHAPNLQAILAADLRPY